jgi:hypothetical protein
MKTFNNRNAFSILILSIASCIIFFVRCSSPSTSKENIAKVDSINYETITLINTYNNCEPTAQNCTYISLEYPQFTNIQPPLLDSLDKHIEKFMGDKQEDKIVEPSALIESFVNDYASFVKKDSSYTIPWTLERKANIVQQNATYITLQFSEYSFEGGAHPNSYVGFVTIDRTTGQQLNLNHFFDSLSIQKLTQLGEPIFCAQKGINPNTSLEDAGYWFANNHFALNNNFYFTNKGITFYYNSYEIAPYVMGPTELTIPASKIVKLFKK